ncbi:MAG: autotransporter-associated beta strand repeat-containing protein [Planctomycetaceae bacterium]|nr:autotransporter-associated beta strand repeat-containing protein [Planctomycetaceae bacterium]
MTKDDVGTLTLTNNNIYTGVTTVRGGTLTLKRATGSLSSSSGLTFGGKGAFNFDNVGASGALSQNLGTLTFSAGEGTAKTTRTANFDEAITFSSLAARTAGATGNFVNGGGVNGATNGFNLTGAAAGFINTGIFYGGSSYAAMDGAGTFVRALNYGVDANTVAVDTITASKHVKLTGSPANQNSITLLSLNLSGSGANWTQNASQTLTVPGILKSGGGTSTISGGTAIAAGAELVIRTDTATDVLDINTAITGTALTKSGAGTLNLNAANNYSGTTTINAGTLAYGIDNAIASGAVTINGGTLDIGSHSDTVGAVTLTAGSIIGSGTLTGSSYTMNNTADTTVSAILGGTGALSKSNYGTLSLSGANTYTGVTTISRGILEVSSLADGGSASSIGQSSNAATNLVFAANDGVIGTLRYIGSGSSTDRLFKINTYSTAAIDASGTGALKFTNPGTLTISGTNYNTTLEFTGSNTGDNTFSPIIPNGNGSNPVYILKTGSGKWILGGANTNTGDTTIRGGTLSVSSLANGGVASNLGKSDSTALNLVLDGGTLQYAGTGSTTGTTNRLFSLGTAWGSLDASGDAGSPLVFNNTGSMGFVGTGTRTLTLTGTNTDANTLAAVIANQSTNATSLTKTGAGKWVLTGANTYTGSTLINAGTLALGGAGRINSSSITVNGATATFITNSSVAVTAPITITQGTIGGTGSINAAVTIGAGAILSPGNSPGTQTYAAGLTWGAGGSYRFEINDILGTAGTDPGWDLVNITGALNLSALSAGNEFIIRLASLKLDNTAGAAANFDSVTPYTWLIADSNTAITTFTGSDQFLVDKTGFTNMAYDTFSVVRGDSVAGGDDTQLYLTYVPEPATMSLLVLGGVAVMLKRRRK